MRARAAAYKSSTRNLLSSRLERDPQRENFPVSRNAPECVYFAFGESCRWRLGTRLDLVDDFSRVVVLLFGWENLRIDGYGIYELRRVFDRFKYF